MWMPNLTLSVPEDLYRRMRRHPDVKWTEVARRAFAEHVTSLERKREGKIRMGELRRIVEERGVDVRAIPLEKAIQFYERMRQTEWQRAKKIYSTQTSS